MASDPADRARETSSHHHLVSRGLQKRWADDAGQLQLVDKVTGKATYPVSTRHALVVKYFNSIRMEDGDNDHLESEWSEIENWAFPDIDRMLSGAIPWEEAQPALKTLAAIHVVRNQSTLALHDSILNAVPDELARESLTDPAVVQGWRDEYGCDPRLDDLLSIARDLADRYTRTRSLFVERLAAIFNQISTELQARHV